MNLHDLATKLLHGEVVWLTVNGERLASLVHRLPDGTFGKIEERIELEGVLQAVTNGEMLTRLAERSPLALIAEGDIFAYLLSPDDSERVLDRKAYHIALEAMESQELDHPDPDQP